MVKTIGINKTVLMEKAVVSIQTGEVDECTDFSITTVKELADSGITQVPPIFLQPQTTRVHYGVRAEQIPVLDLKKLEGDGRTEVLQQIGDACEAWGIFQVVNHGVPTMVMDRMMEAARRFNGEPIDEKMKYYNPADSTALIHYGSGFSSHKLPAAEWKDAIRIMYAPRCPHPSEWPAALRDEGIEYCKHLELMSKRLLNLFSEALSLTPNYLVENIKSMSRQRLNINFYPPSPQPDMTIGTASHSDPGTITILLQDNVGGLRIFKDGNWLGIDPIPGAFVINAGDQLEILSNGKFKSVEHCVVSNSIHERISIAMFFTPVVEASAVIGPIPQLLNSTNPAKYREISFDKYMKNFSSMSSHSKTSLKCAQLN